MSDKKQLTTDEIQAWVTAHTQDLTILQEGVNAAMLEGVEEVVPFLASYFEGRGQPSGGGKFILTDKTINQRVVMAQYAVRGEVPIRAGQLEAELKADPSKFPFNKVLYCNIGNPHVVGQVPLTFPRQVLSLCINPDLLGQPQETLEKLFPVDAIQRARDITSTVQGGLGAYSHSQGHLVFRQDVAKFIEERDGHACDPELIFMSNGASTAIQFIMAVLISGPTDGVLVPIPQYPLYSAQITLLGGSMLPYELDESKGWDLSMAALEEVIASAKAKGVTVKGLCVINPGNPTGSCLTEEAMRLLVGVCEREGIVILADEVYQTNVYEDSLPFVSFKKVVCDTKSSCQLCSFHSTSKGMFGECGLRGGYMELTNIDPSAKAQLYKLSSISLCPNLTGQLMTAVMCQPPKTGPSASLFQQQYQDQFQSLRKRADILSEALNKVEGISLQKVTGSMYAFPTIQLPDSAIEAAQQQGKSPDLLYCLALLNQTGICVVPGNGFGQKRNSFHFRTTFLPPEAEMVEAVEKLAAFHTKYLKQFV